MDPLPESMTAGELLMRCCALEGATFMAGIVDGAHIPFVRHAEAYGVTYVNTRHEEAAVHIAEAHARLTHRPAMVLGNPGPGGANLLAGLTSAFGEGHPIVAIGCTRRAAVNSPDRGGAWQATDLVAMARPITKYAALITRVDRIPDVVRAAFRAATVGAAGPVFITIPDELLGVEVPTAGLRVSDAAHNRVVDVGAGDPGRIVDAAQALCEADRPFLFAGKGVLWADASAEFRELAAHLGAATSTSLGARGVVAEDDPHYFTIADSATLQTVRADADVVLIVGASLGEYDGWGMPPAWGDPATQHTIHLDANPAVFGVNRPVDSAIVADAKRGLEALLAMVRGRMPTPRSELAGGEKFVEKYAALHADVVAEATPRVLAEAKVGMNPGQVVMALREALPRDTVIVADGGNTVLWTVALAPVFEPDSFLYSVKMGYLGTGVPFALGAKLAAPDRPVALISGDGAFGFNAMELETARRVGAAFLAVVMVDAGWGMERTAHRFQGVPDADAQGTELSDEVRYDELARSLGCHGAYVDRIEDLPAAVADALASGLPAVIHAAIDPDLNAEPIGYEQFRAARTY